MDGLYFTEPQELLDYLFDLFTENQISLGLRHIAYLDQKLLPEYPALQLGDCVVNREIVGTHQFGIVWTLDIFILHADLTESYKARTQTDMELATGVKNLLDTDFELGGGVVFGFVDAMFPGVMSRRMGQKTSAVVSTRLSWRGEGRQRF